MILLGVAVALGRARERRGILLATIGLVVAMTAGAIVSLYRELISASSSTTVRT